MGRQEYYLTYADQVRRVTAVLDDADRRHLLLKRLLGRISERENCGVCIAEQAGVFKARICEIGQPSDPQFRSRPTSQKSNRAVAVLLDADPRPRQASEKLRRARHWRG